MFHFQTIEKIIFFHPYFLTLNYRGKKLFTKFKNEINK